MKKLKARCEEAAEQFIRILIPDFRAANLSQQTFPELTVAWSHVEAAFRLYALEWDCHDHDIREWKWPAISLRAGRFNGDEPWGVLFREAVKILTLWVVKQQLADKAASG